MEYKDAGRPGLVMRGRDEEVNSETGTCCDCGSKQKPLVNGVKGIVHPKLPFFLVI